MRQKIALVVASTAATLTLAAALAAAGFAPGGSSAASTASAPTIPTLDPATADATPEVRIDTVYVAPPPKQQTVTVHRVVRTAGGESESDHESGGND